MSDDTGGLTLGERIRKIEEDGAATRIMVSEIVSRDRADLVRITALTDRVSALESSITWAWRTIIAAVIGVAVSVIYRL